MAWPRDTMPLCFNHRLRRKGRRHDSDGEHTPVCVESDRNVTLASTQRLFIDGRHWSIPRSISVERKASFISAVDNTVFEISFHGLWEQVDTWLTYLNRTLIKSSQPESRIWFHTDTQRDAARPSPAASTARAREGKHVAARKKKRGYFYILCAIFHITVMYNLHFTVLFWRLSWEVLCHILSALVPGCWESSLPS